MRPLRLRPPLALLAASLFTLTLSAVAHAAPRRATTPQHQGLLLRLDGGLGYFAASPSKQDDLTLHGPVVALGLSLGGSLSPNWALAGRLWLLAAPSPTVSYGSISYNNSSSSAALGAIGPELTYYFTPSNLYLSAALGLSRLTFTVEDTTSSTQVGVAGQLSVGKEWWVGRRWGLGLAGQLTASANKDSDAAEAPTWGAWAGAVVFSATYN